MWWLRLHRLELQAERERVLVAPLHISEAKALFRLRRSLLARAEELARSVEERALAEELCSRITSCLRRHRSVAGAIRLDPAWADGARGSALRTT